MTRIYEVCEPDLNYYCDVDLTGEEKRVIVVNGRNARYSAQHGVYILDPIKEDTHG